MIAQGVLARALERKVEKDVLQYEEEMLRRMVNR